MATNYHEMKRCTRCNQIYPRTDEYFHRQGKGGLLRSICKTCFNAGRRESRTNRDYPHDHRARRKAETPCIVRVIENVQTGKRRALRYDEWDKPLDDGWVEIGTGSHLLFEQWDKSA